MADEVTGLQTVEDLTAEVRDLKGRLQRNEERLLGIVQDIEELKKRLSALECSNSYVEALSHILVSARAIFLILFLVLLTYSHVRQPPAKCGSTFICRHRNCRLPVKAGMG